MRAAQQLNSVGLKATGPRLVILGVFSEHERRHLTADEIRAWMVRSGGAIIGVATVYRVLNQLTDVGILTRTTFSGRAAVYELHQKHQHDHLICSECGRIDEFSDELIARRSRSIAVSSGYALVSHQLALYGACPACLAKQKKQKKPRRG